MSEIDDFVAKMMVDAEEMVAGVRNVRDPLLASTRARAQTLDERAASVASSTTRSTLHQQYPNITTSYTRLQWTTKLTTQ